MEQSDNELFVSVLPSALTGTFRGNRFTFDYRSHPPPLLKAMESSTARMDNHRTDHHVLHLSICLELIRTITIQSIPFNTRFLSFHPEQSNTLYQRFDRYSFLISSFTGKLLTFIVSVWNCFRTNFLQTKRLPYVTGYKSGTCCRMALLWQNFVFYTPVNQLYTFINPEYGMRYIYVYYALFLIPLCSVFLSGRKENRYISIAFPFS